MDKVNGAIQRVTLKHLRGKHDQKTHANRGLSAGSMSPKELDRNIDILSRDVAVITGDSNSIKISSKYSKEFVDAIKNTISPEERRWNSVDKSWEITNSNPKSSAVGRALYAVQEHYSPVDARKMTETQKKAAVFNANMNRILAGKKVAEANPEILPALRHERAGLESRISQMGRARSGSSFSDKSGLGTVSRRIELAIVGIIKPEAELRAWQNTHLENDLGTIAYLMKAYILGEE